MYQSASLLQVKDRLCNYCWFPPPFKTWGCWGAVKVGELERWNLRVPQTNSESSIVLTSLFSRVRGRITRGRVRGGLNQV